MKKWVMLLAMLALPVQALEVVREALVPGGYFIGRVAPGSNVTFGGEKVRVSEEGLFGIGFSRTAGTTQKVQVCEPRRACEMMVLGLKEREYKTQNIKGVPPKTVNPPADEMKRIAADTKAIKAARNRFYDGAAFADGFALPLEAPTTGVFGSRRTYNGEERSWHKGHDLAAPIGTPVYAPAKGVVRLAQDTFFNGNLVILDHGYSFYSLYAHLDAMTVKEGEEIEKGDKIGTVGTTGRSTGPHLHWGVYWRQVALDPWLWIAHNEGNRK